MDGNDPDLEAFESNHLAIIWAREWVKTAALVSTLCQNASDPQSVGISSRDDHDTSTEWKIEHISTLLQAAGLQGKLIEEQYLPTVPVPVHSMECVYNLAAEPDREWLKLQILGYVQIDR